MRELASDAEKAEMAATDPLTAAATAATRPLNADFFKALFASIEENSAENHGQLPRGSSSQTGHWPHWRTVRWI